MFCCRHFYCVQIEPHCKHRSIEFLTTQTGQSKGDILINYVLSYEYTNHNRLLKEFGWLSVRNLIKLDMGVFMYKRQNGIAPEEFNQLFVPVGSIHGCLTRSAQNGNLQ